MHANGGRHKTTKHNSNKNNNKIKHLYNSWRFDIKLLQVVFGLMVHYLLQQTILYYPIIEPQPPLGTTYIPFDSMWYEVIYLIVSFRSFFFLDLLPCAALTDRVNPALTDSYTWTKLKLVLRLENDFKLKWKTLKAS